jgi:murein DD-endopeptidase MepM/ murein hydrolase activator NlpD
MVLHNPFRNIPITVFFGKDFSQHPEKKDFYTVFGNKHPGVDFEIPIGTPVTVAFPGIVARKEFHKGMGNVVGIRNGNIVGLYAHLSGFSVELGQIVEVGELVGLSGDTGNTCSAPHLHFELRDISKGNLAEMVFEPKFGELIKQYRTTFTYTVNNTNTKKTLENLSKLFFGVEDYWGLIGKTNNLSEKPDQVLSQGEKLIIPNY